MPERALRSRAAKSLAPGPPASAPPETAPGADKLAALRDALEAVDPGGDGVRIDGWTGERRRAFLEHLADGLSVERACARVGLSSASAYALRRRPGGAAFALGWRAARLIGRDHLAEMLISRAIDGQVDTWTRADGQEVTRHRHDNRLAMGLLTRLDRLADEADFAPRPPSGAARSGGGAGGEASFTRRVPSPDNPADAARAVAGEFSAFLDLVAQEGETAADADAVRAFVTTVIDARYPQLPQLGQSGAADAVGGAAPLYWWQFGGWRTALPPPHDYYGGSAGVLGEPGYSRNLTFNEEAIAEALYGDGEDEDDE